MRFLFIKKNDFTLNIFKILLLILMTVTVSIIVYFTGGTSGSWAQLNFITIVLAAYLFREKGSLLVALSSGIILGPFMPNNRFFNIVQTPSNWLFRIFIYIFIAYFVSFIFKQNDKLHKKISDSQYINHFTGLYNSNKLIKDLHQIILNNECFFILFY